MHIFWVNISIFLCFLHVSYPPHCSTYNTAYTDACTTHHTIKYRNCIYKRLTEDELSGSKHVEDIKKLKTWNFNLEKWILLVYIVYN